MKGYAEKLVAASQTDNVVVSATEEGKVSLIVVTSANDTTHGIATFKNKGNSVMTVKVPVKESTILPFVGEGWAVNNLLVTTDANCTVTLFLKKRKAN